MANTRTKVQHDLHVPLSSSLSSSNRKNEARSYQTRLHQLGYYGLAFCHSAYGKLDLKRDDADVALPWKDLLPDWTSPSSSAAARNKDGDEQFAITEERVAFGRTNSLGMKVYRRLNIIVEEVSDVSRILLPNPSGVDASTIDSATSSEKKLLQKYDIVSLQPMNEASLQNICELLSPPSADNISNITTDSLPSNKDNNTNCIDIIVLEYATGSRGGYGLPYRLRREYLVKALSAGVTFELWCVCIQ